jgi:CRP-like cAMP-binding protein
MTAFHLAPESNFLAGLPSEMKAKFLRASHMRDCKAGVLIHQSGQDSGSMSIIRSGTVRMSNLGIDGAQVTIADLGPGESFGLMPLLSGRSRTHDAHAITDVRLLELNRPSLKRLMDEAPDLRDWVISQLADRLMRALEAVEDERRLPLKNRLAKLILQKAQGSKSVRTTQSALADELGASRYGVGLGLKELADNGLVQTAYGAVLILDSFRLQRLL